MEIKKTILFLIIIIILGISLYFIIDRNRGVQKNFNLESQTNEANGIIFQAQPIDFNKRSQVKFEIKIDTHSGSLDFDLTKISFLEDDLGNKYMPLEWQGPEPGGHHLSGVILFPPVNNNVKKIKLTIQDSILRIFEWPLDK